MRSSFIASIVVCGADYCLLKQTTTEAHIYKEIQREIDRQIQKKRQTKEAAQRDEINLHELIDPQPELHMHIYRDDTKR